MNVKIGIFRINVICPFLAAAFLLMNFSVYTLLIALCVLCHEIGHIVMIRRAGQTVQRIDILPFGADIITEGRLLSYADDLKIALAGSVFNLAAAALCFLVLAAAGYNEHMIFYIAVNLAYAAINLFPVRNLDGGRAAEIILRCHLPPERVFVLCGVISAAALALLTACAFFVLFATGYNFSLVLICAYLFFVIHFKPRVE